MSMTRTQSIVLAFLCYCLSSNVAFSQRVDWDQRVDELLETKEGDIVLTAVGDMIFNREITGIEDPPYQNLYRIIETSDIGFGNLEMSLNEKPELQKGVYNFRRGRDFGWEILKLGINLVGIANNHAFDYGPEGLLDDMRILRQSGIAFAGGGKNLADAQAPVYKQVGRTRIALLSFMSGADWGKADPGEPSISVINAPRVFLDGNDGIDGRGIPAPLASDVRAMEDAIATAKRNADIVLVAYHLHWVSHSRAYSLPNKVPPHQQLMLKRAIDAGADAILGSGPHVLRGIEMYKGKPIFYSLGDFIYQYRTTDIPEIHWNRDQQQDVREEFDTVVARMTIRDKKISKIQLVPVASEMTGPRTGSPSLARGDDSERILKAIVDLSADFGTKIEVNGWYGEVQPN
jgi:poly-gamma-glutamate capsule biosynthesis protein CapA/YwtB (metallophosphatase superfamily)